MDMETYATTALLYLTQPRRIQMGMEQGMHVMRMTTMIQSRMQMTTVLLQLTPTRGIQMGME